jgi:hypothetical protein
MKFLRVDDDLHLLLDGTTDRMEIRGWFSEKNASSRSLKVSFQTGEKLDAEAFAANVLPAEQPVEVAVYQAINYVLGADEDQCLVGMKDKDTTFISNLGDDIVAGNGGNNIFYYAKGLGNDTILNRKWRGEYGTLRFHTDIASADVSVSRSENDVIFQIAEGSVTVKDWFRDDCFKLDNVAFFDGDVWDARDVENLANGVPLAEREYYFTVPGYKPESGRLLRYLWPY